MLRATHISREAYGFIGLGQMGSRMCPNFFKNNKNNKNNNNCSEINIYDPSNAAMEQVQKLSQGKVNICKSPAEVAANSTKILTMLPNTAIVNDVYCNNNSGIFTSVRPGTLLVDSSTIGCTLPKVLGDIANFKQCVFADAPVSGGIMAAEAGSLVFMVGCNNININNDNDNDILSQIKTFLTPLAKAVIPCGAAGTGQAVKLSNNIILAQHMIAVSEGMLLGTILGVDPKVLSNVFSQSTSRCWSGDSYNPYPGVMAGVPAARGYNGGFANSLMVKDLTLAMEAAEGVGLLCNGGALAHGVYSDIVKSGMGDKDFSYVIQHLNGKKLGW